MGDISTHAPVLHLTAAFSRYDVALDWTAQKVESVWGPIALASPRFEFAETDYYQPTMGPNLKKCFWAFEHLADPSLLPNRKIQANTWEIEYASAAHHAESRPLNIDPGYMTPAKLVLASTKDHAHRIYVDGGIFAEVTLYFRDRQWQVRDWTFPDYRRADFHRFFEECRDYLRRRSRESAGS